MEHWSGTLCALLLNHEGHSQCPFLAWTGAFLCVCVCGRGGQRSNLSTGVPMEVEGIYCPFFPRARKREGLNFCCPGSSALRPPFLDALAARCLRASSPTPRCAFSGELHDLSPSAEPVSPSLRAEARQSLRGKTPWHELSANRNIMRRRTADVYCVRPINSFFLPPLLIFSKPTTKYNN